MRSLIHPYYFSKKKRVFDVVFAFGALAAGWPLVVAIGLILWLSQGSPILFVQTRVGKNKKQFLLYKFRTMVVGAEGMRKKLLHINEAPYPMFKLRSDPRFTRFGSILSRTGLDELPQLLNIIKGDMSLVGPRPLPLEEARLLPKNWITRTEVRPGLISNWAVSKDRFRSLTSWKRLELVSLQKGNIYLDILLIQKVLKGLFKNLFRIG